MKEIEEKSKAEKRRIEELFLNILLNEGGSMAVKYFLNGWTYPSDSEMEEVYNNAIKVIARQIRIAFEEGDITLMDALELFERYKPFTHKTKYFQDYYLKSYDVWEEELENILRHLSYSKAKLLSSNLFRFWTRSRVQVRQELPFFSRAGFRNIRLVRFVKEDKWYLEFEYKGKKFRSEFYVKLGHLGVGKLTTSTDYERWDNDTEKITLMIDYKIGVPYETQIPGHLELYKHGNDFFVTLLLSHYLVEGFKYLVDYRLRVIDDPIYCNEKIYDVESDIVTLKDEDKYCLKVPKEINSVLIRHYDDKRAIAVVKNQTKCNNWYIFIEKTPHLEIQKFPSYKITNIIKEVENGKDNESIRTN